jgi:hypothetical protein
MGQERLFV